MPKVELNEVLNTLVNDQPEAYSYIQGSKDYPDIMGLVLFYPLWQGTLIVAEVHGLPYSEAPCSERVFGFHLHEGEYCTGEAADPFANTKGHYNPGNCEHPEHAGDFPPLFGNQGYALEIFYTERFLPSAAIGKTVVVHNMPDDFKSQPSGDSGGKIACGEVKENPVG